ncbi:transcriptional regulator, ArsR family [Anaerovirgula multivorans]|uniref:Transcriptional regulator, ArsR family n=1 Tax=Anaerovirgula multivorans TaxID=312168 RepID=A0A239AT86_9FIRM|nr:metalloregulator ArsR/SmtB family transcription factor [Anaerovirgula multivorans]SNR98915.1 transcriptional regulator, ArsR family [Anaerovirgula multivorans]
MKAYADLFKALSDENRLKILLMLTYGEMCACDIQDQLDLTQPTISHHMKVLQKAELVNIDKRGKWMYYSINDKRAQELCKMVKEITTSCEERGCSFKEHKCNDEFNKVGKDYENRCK